MKRILVLMGLALALAGCDKGDGLGLLGWSGAWT